MKKRIGRILIISLVVLFAIFFLGSRFMAKRWGRDVEKISVIEGPFSFRGERDAAGVWKVIVKDEKSLWFAFGYVQAVDREFQTELFRHIARGQLSSLFGESQLSRDRLMRLSSRVAQKEWDNLPADHVLRSAAESYVAGRKKFFVDAPTEDPVEFRLINRPRSSFEEWAPWEVLAIVRFHTWEFSFDIYEEIRQLSLQKTLGDDYGNFLFPVEDKATMGLYGQPGVAAGVKSRLGSTSGLKDPVPFYSQIAGNKQSRLAPPKSSQYAQVSPFSDAYREVGFGAEEGASNLWMIADPKTGLEPTLCNDTHLGFSYPSPLYPVRFEIEGKISGQGYMLPGLPAVVIGLTNTGEDKFVYGITMGSYGDTQDLVYLSPGSLKEAKVQSETYVITDPKTGVRKETTLDETWTKFGPRVDGIFKWPSDTEIPPLALDWMGYRDAATPLEFFIRRNIMGATDLRADLSNKWPYPVVNFTWIDSVGKEAPRFGHALTGLMFSRDRKGPRGPISEALARTRSISQPKDRPYLDYAYEKKGRFLMATGNQKVFTGDISQRIASDWVDNSRTQRILDKSDELSVNPVSSQHDYFSPTLAQFYRRMRERHSADRLCGVGTDPERKFCTELVSGLDRWNGQMLKDSWQPTLIVLWYEKIKEGLLPPGFAKSDTSRMELLSSWAGGVGSTRIMHQMLEDKKTVEKWESFSKANFNDMSLQAFQTSLELLMKELGPVTDRWAWGLLHSIRWQHPFALIPAPLGPMLRDGVLGLSPGVPGGLDSPGRFDFKWRPDKPLDFGSNHGSVTRMCSTLKAGQKLTVDWSIPTGTSGNPFSKWSKVMPQEYFFKDKLFSSPD